MAKTRSARQHFTAGQRAQIIQDFRQAQLSQKEFAAQAGIGVTTLQSWLRKAASTTSGMQLEVCSGFRPEELTTLLRVVREL